MRKIITIAILLLGWALQSHAVLKEKDLDNTLGILRTELTKHHAELERTLQGLVERMKGSRVVFGALAALIGLATVVVVFLKNQVINNFAAMADSEVSMDTIGRSLVSSDRFGYVLPFEFISVFLLACIIGGIVISRKE